MTLTAHLPALPGLRIEEHLVLGGVPDELPHSNGPADPDRVHPRISNDNTLTGDRLTAVLPPVSWTMLRLVPTRH